MLKWCAKWEKIGLAHHFSTFFLVVIIILLTLQRFKSRSYETKDYWAQEEQRDLGQWRDSGKPEFIAVYGRRRIGKTFLVKQFFKNKFDFYITGAYNASKKDQLFNFKMTL